MSKRRLAVLICTLTFLSCTASTYTFKWSQSSHPSQEHQKYGPRHIQTPGLLEPRSCVYCWLGICGTERGKAKWFHKVLRLIYRHRLSEEDDIFDARIKKDARPEDWTNDPRVLHEIPQYVLEYAPLVHLYSEEKFWPCDIAEHLFHVTPNLNYTPIQSQSRLLNLTNLDQLNEWDGGNMVYLTSNDNVEERPDWLVGQKNIPDIPRDSDELQRQHVNHIGKLPTLPCNDNDGDKIPCDTNLKMSLQSADYQAFHLDRGQATLGSKREQRGINGRPAEKGTRSSSIDDEREEKPGEQPGGRSDAPAVLIVVNKGHGIIDAFWFFFYSYNLGNSVFNIRFGNHVGDWEHTLVRFQHGKPKYVFFSEHNFGSAYTYGAVEKIGKRVSRFFSHYDRRLEVTDLKSL